MTVADIKNLEPGAKGIEVGGSLKLIYEPKARFNPINKKKEYNQFCVLDDGDDSIGMSLHGIELPESNKGKVVSVKNASLRSYMDAKNKSQLILDVTPPEGAVVLREVTTESTEPIKKEAPLVTLSKILGEVADFMTLPSSVNMIKAVKDAGWTSEDLRAIMITVFLDSKRGN